VNLFFAHDGSAHPEAKTDSTLLAVLAIVGVSVVLLTLVLIIINKIGRKAVAKEKTED
jgi:hypothetical protein